jgi:hypothetical protein
MSAAPAPACIQSETFQSSVFAKVGFRRVVRCDGRALKLRQQRIKASPQERRGHGRVFDVADVSGS